MIDIDRILSTMNERGVRFMMIGGMHFFIHHVAVATQDVDLWIEDTEENHRACENALSDLKAEWGHGDDDWGPVAEKPSGWLSRRGVYCLLSEAGPIDIFQNVTGLIDWRESFNRSIKVTTQGGATYRGLCDADMLACQHALDEGVRKKDRISHLKQQIKDSSEDSTNG